MEREESISAITKDILQLRVGGAGGKGVIGALRGRESFVDFDKFCKTYWAHFPQEYKSNLSE